jgi:hypothetical protein
MGWGLIKVGGYCFGDVGNVTAELEVIHANSIVIQKGDDGYVVTAGQVLLQ